MAAFTASGEASACIVMPVTYFGHHRPSEREIAEQEERLARDLVRQRHPVAQAALAGGIDAPAELARMLVPNIRPIPIEHNDCGPENEIDLGDGEERIEDWLAGTYLVRYSNEFAHMVWSYRGETLGAARVAPRLVRGPPPAAPGALGKLLQAGDRTLDAPHRGGPGAAASGG